MNGVRFKLEMDPPRVLAQTGKTALELPALWLRERCQDAANLDAQTQQRLFDPHRLPDDLALVRVEASGENRARLAFSDGYAGEYELSRLADELEPEGRPPARDSLAC